MVVVQRGVWSVEEIGNLLLGVAEAGSLGEQTVEFREGFQAALRAVGKAIGLALYLPPRIVIMPPQERARWKSS